ncbi:agmatine deiminase family protein, partial [Bacillus hominis]|uniref:agmatine deiminase family protein n=1 Tax=Bacillus hominis TaxID=2817478 RepID=UPI001BB3198D
MKKVVKLCLISALSTAIISGCSFEGNNENAKGKENGKVEVQKTVGKYTMPDEKDKHEGTWLQWPHEYTYGEEYKQEVEPIWVKMASALTEGEKVHIVAYDEEEKERINKLLIEKGLNMDKIDF